MNRNEYRRALIMLRSLKAGVSGYVRLERRTLMGTLQFTVNGVDSGGELYAILLYRNNGGWSGIRLDAFGAPRYGQTGLVWKFDPRNIEGRTLEQYDLAAVIEIRNGVCELLLCGNLNGSVEADWAQVREAACRLFSPIRISGAPISPIDERKPASDTENEGIQTLPEYGKEAHAYPGDPPTEASAPTAESSNAQEPVQQRTAVGEMQTALDGSDSCGCNDDSSVFSSGNMSGSYMEPDDLDVPADGSETEPDELDTPAQDAAFMIAARAALSAAANPDDTPIEPDEFATPAQETYAEELTAGDQLALDDSNAAWPESIEPLRVLFFSSEAVVPFDTAGYVFIRAALPEESGFASCLIGLLCENGVPAKVCYAIPAAYTPEPPTGLEGYVWRGDHSRGYWVICEEVQAMNG